ncbi:inactive leucine-rich repeat receptor-like protein kinase [Populus alba x Populus x berolinensis]|uniref:Inactive leucine-rich repeat receptor-like protein kinase n=1 Tax=Populus alba x Populus x berolinensis TaxID=444605 RepID=A0AAD6LDT7_9ROSI|nr:inactive leucine-rich repeat receptor-like protein kinase [Populus alba x Populus x berolinensis]
MALDAKLALFFIHILSVAGNGYSSLQERTTTGVKMNTGKSWILLSIIVGFLSCCAPWVHVKKRNKKITIQTMVMLILRKNRKEADNLSSSPSFENIQGGGKEAKIMEWTVRFKVAIGLARGLSWLHQDCSSTIRVYHLNISSKCILLDQDFEPKLSNFGEAIIVNPTTTSPLNGEFWDTAFAKEDVYGFGVVLLELITGVDSSRMTGSSNSLLNEWISHLLTSSKIYDAIDKSLVGQGFDDEIFQLLKVACNCVDSIPDRRPTMHQVYKDIRAMRERCGQIDDSEILVQHHDIYPPSSKGKSVEIEMAVAGNGYSSSQDNDHGGDDHEHRKKLISSLKSGFVIGYVFSSVSFITIFMSYCVPWARLMKRKGNDVMMKTPMMTSLMERQEKKRKEADIQSYSDELSNPNG